jgi:hypothetical protein
MGASRRGEREPGKSDEIDALAIARAVVKDGAERFPTAHLDERAMEIRLLSDHRKDLVVERARLSARVVSAAAQPGSRAPRYRFPHRAALRVDPRALSRAPQRDSAARVGRTTGATVDARPEPAAGTRGTERRLGSPRGLPAVPPSSARLGVAWRALS